MYFLVLPHFFNPKILSVIEKEHNTMECNYTFMYINLSVKISYKFIKIV